MWFKSKKSNRRFEREHVLEVKMRARQIRAARLRVAAKAASVIVGTALAFGGFWYGSDWALNEWLFKNPAFRIQHLQVQTDGEIPIEQILTWAGVKSGDSLLAIDLLRIERDLRLQPQIENVAVTRVLPDTLKIRITEREPIAQVSGFPTQPAGSPIMPTTLYLDPAGFVISPLETARHPDLGAPNSEAFPVLTGVLGTELRPGRRAESPEVQAALKFLIAFDRSPMIGVVDLKSIDLSSPPVLQVTTRQGNEVILPAEDFDRQLRRWRAVHELASQEARQIASLDLSVSNNVPVRWHEAGTPAPPPAKTQKATRSKRKHV